MLRMVSDADFNGRLLQALFRRQHDLDLIRVQDVQLRTAHDRDVLAWAAAEGRILLSHDFRTMPTFAYERLNAGLPMPGVFLVPNQLPRFGTAVEEILLMALCSQQGEWKDRVIYLRCEG